MSVVFSLDRKKFKRLKQRIFHQTSVLPSTTSDETQWMLSKLSNLDLRQTNQFQWFLLSWHVVLEQVSSGCRKFQKISGVFLQQDLLQKQLQHDDGNTWRQKWDFLLWWNVGNLIRRELNDSYSFPLTVRQQLRSNHFIPSVVSPRSRCWEPSPESKVPNLE